MEGTTPFQKKRYLSAVIRQFFNWGHLEITVFFYVIFNTSTFNFYLITYVNRIVYNVCNFHDEKDSVFKYAFLGLHYKAGYIFLGIHALPNVVHRMLNTFPWYPGLYESYQTQQKIN